MFRLDATTACGDTFPTKIGDCQLSLSEPRYITSLAPRAGQKQALSRMLDDDYGIGLPDWGKLHARDSNFICPFGHAHYFLFGERSAMHLDGVAHVTDQSSAWATIAMDSPQIVDILARLAPVDLNTAVFPANTVAQTEAARIHTLLFRISTTEFRVMAPRSMAKALAAAVIRAAHDVSKRPD
ncbi:hypothetical protein [uncultured Ruegeria sp.]|uniref:hypothetical protein n=1 Tax=uncultured Ruegeria sp. TaxID=259304 RepID=UPI00261B6A1A|nr:hypothetical protein [uncultured Ruegeria sp.]